METKEKSNKNFNYWKYFKQHKLGISFYLIILLIDVAIQTFYSIYGALIVVDVANGAYLVAANKFVTILIVIIFSLLFQYLRNVIYYNVSNNIINAMRVDIAFQSFKISDRAYADHQMANFTQRISSDPSTIFGSLSNLVSVIQHIITSLIITIYISILNYKVGIIVVLLATALIIIERIRKRLRKKNEKELHKRKEKATSLLNEVVRSQKDIKSLNLEQKLKENIAQTADSHAEQVIKTNKTNLKLQILRALVVNVLITILVVLALIDLNLGLLTLASYMIIHNNRGQATSFSSYLSQVVDYFAEIELASIRINELFEDDEYELEKFGTKTLKDVNGEIEFKNVSFGYIEYREKSEEEIKQELKQNKKNKIKTKVKTREITGKNQIFNNLSFKIEPNTTVAFVGKSGTGKSTILNLISKMYEADKGKVLIDGVDIKKLSKESLRSSISLVNQFPYIFDMTIKENLLLAKPDATDKEIDDAIHQSALDEFIKTLPNGLNTKVGESGIKLSGGQRQRVAIARAMLKKSPIIIFDESTSSLDNIAQAQIKKSIDNIKGKSTVVIVAHRLSTIKNVDKIFFLEDGEIVDSGTFKELYKRNKSFKHIFLAEDV